VIPIPLVIALALLVMAGLCWAGHRRCRRDDLDNAQREAALAVVVPARSSHGSLQLPTWFDQPADEEVPAR
jgi:hypothetical protein